MANPAKLLLIATAALPAVFAQPTPDPTEQKAIIERARAATLDYSKNLANFTCTRTMTRSADDSTTGKHYKKLDTQEGELSLIDHKERYAPQKINGKPIAPNNNIKQGYFLPGGEFGAFLLKIFEPKVNAEFTFDRAETADGRPSCLFRYNVPLAATTLSIFADGETYPLAHHGQVRVDCETGAVTWFHLESDTPTVVFKGHKIVIGNNLEVRYAPTAIGDRQFLLPEAATEVSRFHKRLTKVDIEFRQYRKYDSASTITFGPDK